MENGPRSYSSRTWRSDNRNTLAGHDAETHVTQLLLLLLLLLLPFLLFLLLLLLLGHVVGEADVPELDV